MADTVEQRQASNLLDDCSKLLSDTFAAAATSNGNKEEVGKKTPPAPNNDYERGKPKILSKAKFCTAYEVTASLKYVAIERFSPELFMYQALLQWAKQAQEYSIYTSKDTGVSVCMLRYAGVQEGEEAYRNLKECLVNEDCEVRHPKITGGTPVQWICSAVDTGLLGLMGHAYQEKDKVKDAFGQRALILEHMPPCSSEELLDMFTEAINIVNFTLDEFIQDSVVVELKSKERAEKFIEKYNGSTIKDKTICVNYLLPRIQKLTDSSKKFNKKFGEETVLSDEARLESILEFIKVHDEKEAILSRDDITGYDKERRFFEIEKIWDPLQRSLFSDAKRRFDNNIPLAEKPENVPTSMQKLVFGKGVLDKREAHRQLSQQIEEEKRKKRQQEIDEQMRRAEEKAAGGAILIPKKAAQTSQQRGDTGKDMIPVPQKGGHKRASDMEPAPQYAKRAYSKPSTAPSLLDMDLTSPSRGDSQRDYRDRDPYDRSISRNYGGRSPPRESKRPPLLSNPVDYRGRQQGQDFRDPNYPYRGGYGQPQQAVDYEQEVLVDRAKAQSGYAASRNRDYGRQGSGQDLIPRGNRRR